MPKKEVRYVIGDATRPQGDGLKIVAHVCNNLGAWGAGFVLALSKRWKRPEAEYLRWAKEHGREEFQEMLGAMQLVPVDHDIWVANIIGQQGLGPKGKEPPIRYEALAHGFRNIAKFALDHPEKNISVHGPRMGAGLAGGKWEEIEKRLLENLVSKGIPVTIYDLP